MSKRAHSSMSQRVGVNGSTVWKYRGAEFFWNGPGGRVYLLWGAKGALTPIDIPGLDHGFPSRVSARKALLSRWPKH
jgi:hypothetical protein